MTDDSRHSGKEPIRVIVSSEFQDIMPRYLEIRVEELEQLRAAIDAEDAPLVRMLGHRLKGSGGSYGFDELSRLGIELETAGMEERLSDACRLMKELEYYLSNLEIIYDGEDE